MDGIKIVKSLGESGLLIKGIRETIENEAEKQKGEFLSMLLGKSGASSLGNMLAGNGVIQAGEGVIGTSWGQDTIRAGQDFYAASFLNLFWNTKLLSKLS